MTETEQATDYRGFPLGSDGAFIRCEEVMEKLPAQWVVNFAICGLLLAVLIAGVLRFLE